jgi:hypothetical protein
MYWTEEIDFAAAYATADLPAFSRRFVSAESNHLILGRTKPPDFRLCGSNVLWLQILPATIDLVQIRTGYPGSAKFLERNQETNENWVCQS